MSARKTLPAFEDRAPRDRYCDLILTGGVTSAIAYPAAIFALASAYRFNSIGGSSSGAGTAALAAAAEYRRRHGSSEGYRLLLERTAAVSETVGGKTRLAWLFQPARHHARLFEALVPGFASPTRKTWVLLRGLSSVYGISAVGFGLALGLFVWWLGAVVFEQSWRESTAVGALAAASVVAGAIASGGLFLLRDIARVVDDDYGLCTGMSDGERTPHPPLTQWLHELIQEIAGRALNAPLTFADLERAPGSPRDTLGDFSPPGAVSINLQMYTANVTHGRPYVLPQPESMDEDGDPPLYFRPGELRRLFPREVVDFMIGTSIRHEDAAVAPATKTRKWWEKLLLPSPGAGGPDLSGEDGELRRLPRRQLPIVVAARMSVSFPVLFSAVPLWVPDTREKGPPVFRRCLFSDGSLCSNFPIHLFDSLLPPWPTFGISLYDLPPWAPVPPESSSNSDDDDEDEFGKVSLPDDHRKGRDVRWYEFDRVQGTLERMAAFSTALVYTTLNWNDAMLARLPGVRDRVAQVGLRPHIGGLNILMKTSEIDGLARLGSKAARKLLTRFGRRSTKGNGEFDDGWAEHRWVRFNVVCNSLARSLAGVTWSATHDRYARPIPQMIREAIDAPPCAGDPDTKLTPADAAALEGALTALMAAERALAGGGVADQPYRPSPRPDMRVRPPL